MGLENLRVKLGPACAVSGVVVMSLALAQCNQTTNKYGVSPSARVIAPGEPVPKGGGVYRVGKPYVVAGRTYTPAENPQYSASGLASWYGDDFHGRLTANGEIFDMTAISAAHPTLPIPSYVRVTNLENRRSLVVRVNDRGPYHADRVIDVSVRAAKLLGFYETGTTRVRVDYVGRAALEGSDDAKLAATLRQDAPIASTAVALRRQPLQRFDFKPPSAPTAVAQTPPAAAPAYSLAASRTAPPAAPRTVVAEQPTSFETRFGRPTIAQPPASGEPVSAYAPVTPAPSGVLIGRGLY